MRENYFETGNDNLLKQDRETIWHPFTPLHGPDPIIISRGDGIYLHTVDNRKIIDGISSWWVNLHGHSNPVIAQAIADQAITLEHVIFAGFSHEPAIRLAKNLLQILPSNQEKIFFSDNGSTAVEVALKLGIQYWHNLNKPKRKVVAFTDAYHGDTFGSMAVGSRGAVNKAFQPFLFDVEFIPVPTESNIDSVSGTLESILQGGDVAAFIFEPLVQAAAGMIMYTASHLDNLLAICKRYDVVTIADEVFTGFGRTGKLFASDYLTHQPDLITLSKGITGGALPLGVTSVSSRILSAYQDKNADKTFYHGHSYTANPLACAAANASFSLTTGEICQKQITMITKSHLTLRDKISGHVVVKDVRCLGTIIAIELLTSENTSYFNSLRDRIYDHFLKKNILLRPLGNVFYILPPYVITREELESIYHEIEAFLNELSLR